MKINAAPKPAIRLKGIPVREVETHKHLGLTFNSSLSWSDHIGNLTTKAAKCVGLLKRICRDVPRECLEVLYKAMIRPILEYGDVIFDNIFDNSYNIYTKRLENVQRQAALTCTGAYKHTKHEKLLEELGWPPLMMRRKHHRMNVMYKIQTGMAPPYLTNACPQLTRDRTCYNLRSGMDVTAPQTRTATYQKSFFPQTIKDWNSLGRTVREVDNITKFKDHLKTNTGYKTNKLYQHSISKSAINQTRMRLGLSGLSSQRFDYKHIDDPKCLTCNAKIEDPEHYFLTCHCSKGKLPEGNL